MSPVDWLDFIIVLLVSSLACTIIFDMPTHIAEFIYFMSLGYYKQFYFFMVIITIIIYFEGCYFYATRLVNKLARESLCFFFINACFYVAIIPRILYIIYPEASTFYVYCILFENLVYYFIFISLLLFNLHYLPVTLCLAEPEIKTYLLSYLIGFIILNAFFNFCWVWPNNF